MDRLTLIGTSHIAKDSVNRVREAVESKPDIVAVELDHARLHALFSREKSKPNLAMLKFMGVTGFSFYVIAGFLQRRLGKLIGAIPGEEMKTAVEIARQGSIKVALIDQPLNITMNNLSRIGMREKFRLLKDLLLGMAGLEKGTPSLANLDLQKTPNEDFIETAMKLVKERYPKLFKALVSDRDAYMANALASIMRNEPESRIVAVVGAGHEKAIMRLLKNKE